MTRDEKLTRQREYNTRRDPVKNRRMKYSGHLRRTYGITITTYELMVERQHGRCLICERREHLHVDHDHVTDQVRGLLCGRCNRAIGLLGEETVCLQRAIQYLDGTLRRNVISGEVSVHPTPGTRRKIEPLPQLTLNLYGTSSDTPGASSSISNGTPTNSGG
jgi:hypothetical protein